MNEINCGVLEGRECVGKVGEGVGRGGG